MKLPDEAKESEDGSPSAVKPGTARQIESEIDVCKSVLQKLETARLGKTSPKKISIIFEQFKTLLARANPKFDEDIWASVQEPITLGSLKEKVELILNNLKSVRYLSPIVPTKRGMNGPTFIVEYPTEDGVRTFVLKWTTSTEIASNDIYAAFSNGFTRPGTMPPNRGDYSTGFFVPVTSGILFDRGKHTLCDGRVRNIAREDATRIRAHLIAIKQLHSAKKVDGKQIIFQQKIPGENFIDFILSNFSKLTPKLQSKFFKRLGRLALLDLLMGNLDRFIRFEVGARGYSFHSEANLGNIMVCIKEGTPIIYAIDNAIEGALIHDDKEKRQYNQFLQKLFSNPEYPTLLAREMFKAIQGGLGQARDNNQLLDLKLIQKKQKEFVHSLETIGLPAFKRGIEQMCFLLKSSLLKKWGGARNLKRFITDVDRPLINAVEERLALFSGSISS